MNNMTSIEFSGWTTISKVFYVNVVNDPSDRNDYKAILDFLYNSEIASSIIDPILEDIVKMPKGRQVALFWVHPKCTNGEDCASLYYFSWNIQAHIAAGYLAKIGAVLTLNKPKQVRIEVCINYKIVDVDMAITI